MEKKLAEINIAPVEPAQIRLCIREEELIKLNEQGFFWKGNLVEEDKEIYRRFSEWVNLARKENNLD